MSLARLTIGPRVLRTYDTDASSYISAVETADDESLEQSIKDAITEFVVGCKITGIWDAIKSCCLLAGPRTQNGAIIPLKGTAPTLTSFTGDYNRYYGLKCLSGTFNTNRNSDSDPQNSKHVAVYTTSIDYGVNDSTFRSILTASTISGSTVFAVTSLGLNIRVNTATNIVNNQPVTTNNLIGVSILDSNRTQLLYNKNINIININTATPPSGVGISLFGGAGVSASLSRIAFYSIGESLNLKNLNSVVQNYMTKIYNSLNIVNDYDSDALAYISAVETEDDAALETEIKDAINRFVVGCKNDNIWSGLKACCILMGARTLGGALVPLVGSAPTSVNFVEGDYNRLRLAGAVAASNKSLSSNYSASSPPQNNLHFGCFMVGFPNGTHIGSANVETGGSAFGSNAANADFRNRNAGLARITNGITGRGFYGSSRTASNSFVAIANNVNTLFSSYNSSSPPSVNFRIFGNEAVDGTVTSLASSISFYSVGESLDLQFLSNRINTLYNDIDKVI
jgi:hypothetical protein